MITTELLFEFECDKCGLSGQATIDINHATRPDVRHFEAQALAHFEESDWSCNHGDDGEEVYCPDCKEAA